MDPLDERSECEPPTPRISDTSTRNCQCGTNRNCDFRFGCRTRRSGLQSLCFAAAILWMTTELTFAQSESTETRAIASSNEGRVVLRRLNRTEYENTVRDLLGIDVDLKDLLPLDSSAGGFDNVGEALHTSSFLMERYLDAADKALSVAIANLPQPKLVKNRYSLKDERIVKVTTEDVYRHRDDSLVMLSSSPWNSITVGQFYPPDRGKYRVRISAYGFQSAGKTVTFRIDAGPMLMGTINHLVGYFDAAPDEPTVTEFIDHFDARNHFRISPYGLANAQTVTKVAADKYEGPGLGIEWVEVEGPLHDSWPPESHRRIFGDLAQAPAPIYNHSDRVEVVSGEPAVDADRILRKFARRAFRRTVTDADVKPFIALVESRLAEKCSFEKSIRVGLAAILVSPQFLFLREEPGQLDDFALASRLSYFLWSTMPDEELLELAENGQLAAEGTLGAEGENGRQGEGENITATAILSRSPVPPFSPSSVLSQQVERMLQHPKTEQFTTNFVGQWLALRDIDFTEPSHILYPEFDDMLKVSMVRETELFFAEVLKDDLSLTNFVASDFTMLNGRLANHYGIPMDLSALPSGERGRREGLFVFRRTPLPPGSHRGGMLTMSSVLKVTANGTSTSPVMRGAWILDRILGQPPSPPPDDVAALEPDVRGATTIREQLAKHRQIDSCASCHVDIDPPGFALENFDVIGGWRDRYRTTSWGQHVEEVLIEDRKMPYYKGLNVDPAGVLADGRRFADIDEFKQLLLADKDQLARALTTKLLTYGTGAVPSSADEQQIDAIVAKIRDKNYGFRSLIHEMVQSELFRRK